MFSHQGWLCILLLDQLAHQCISGLETGLRIVYLPWSLGLKATQLSLSDHVQWSETHSFELQSQLSSLKWSSFILSTLCSQREHIGQVLQDCMQREVESPEKSRARTLEIGIVAAARANIAASLSY